MKESIQSNHMEKLPEADSFLAVLEKAKEKPVEAVFILSGGIKKIKKGKVIAGMPIENELSAAEGKPPGYRLSSTAFNDPDPRRSLGWGKAKNIAAAEIAEELNKIQPEQKPVLVTCSRSTNNLAAKSDAEIAAEELRRYGVENEILKEEWSLDTFTELLEAVRMTEENNWKHVAFSTTAYQRPRAEAMLQSLLNAADPAEGKRIEQILAFNAMRFNAEKYPNRARDHRRFKETYDYIKAHHSDAAISFVNAEDCLRHRDARHAEIIKDAKNDPLYAAKQEQDEKAAEQWRAGEYGKVSEEVLERWRKGDLP